MRHHVSASNCRRTRDVLGVDRDSASATLIVILCAAGPKKFRDNFITVPLWHLPSGFSAFVGLLSSLRI